MESSFWMDGRRAPCGGGRDPWMAGPCSKHAKITFSLLVVFDCATRGHIAVFLTVPQLRISHNAATLALAGRLPVYLLPISA